jgi:hypothetical protein
MPSSSGASHSHPIALEKQFGEGFTYSPSIECAEEERFTIRKINAISALIILDGSSYAKVYTL